MNIFSNNSLLGRFLNLTADIFILNIIWLICSLPIITIGASTTALYYAIMKRQRSGEGYVVKNFFTSFKLNFKQSTLIWIIMLCAGFIIELDLRIGISSPGIIGKLMVFSSIFLFIPYSFILIYIFPVQAKFDNPIFTNIKNSLLIAIAHFGYTILNVIFFLIFIALAIKSTMFLGIVILLGFSLYAFITGNTYITIFRKYVPEEIKKDAEASGIDFID